MRSVPDTMTFGELGSGKFELVQDVHPYYLNMKTSLTLIFVFPRLLRLSVRWGIISLLCAPRTKSPHPPPLPISLHSPPTHKSHTSFTRDLAASEIKLLKCWSRELMHWVIFKQDDYSIMGGDGGCRVGEVRAGTTSPCLTIRVLIYSNS